MNLIAFVYLLPFLLILGICLWTMFRRTPRERCKRLFAKIVSHPLYSARIRDTSHRFDLPNLVDAVNDEDVAYLKAYLKGMGRP